MKLFSKRYLFLIGLIVFLVLPQLVFGICGDDEKLCHGECISKKGVCLQIENYPTVPGLDKTLNQIAGGASENVLGGLIQYIYYFIVSIAGLAVFVMLLWGGFSYLTSAGNPAAISDAKDRIFKAILGLIIILSSWLILNTVNPDLTLIKIPGLKPACCVGEEQCSELREKWPDLPFCYEMPALERAHGTIDFSIVFTVDGEEITDQESATIRTGDPFKLRWFSSPDIRNCYASTIPSPSTEVWIGAKSTNNESEEIILSDEGTFTFTLLCYGPRGQDIRNVTVISYSGDTPPTAEAPTVDLKANGFDGPPDDPLTYYPSAIPPENVDHFPGNKMATGELNFVWTVSNADYCFAGGKFTPLSEEEMARGATDVFLFAEDRFSPGSPGNIYDFIITCTGPGGQVSDTVTVKYIGEVY